MEDQTGQPRPSSSAICLGCWRVFETFAGSLLWMNRDKWLDDMRGNLSMVATLICAITFQAALNPPGGVLQASTESNYTRIDCNPSVSSINNETEICIEEAVLAVVYSDNFFKFIKYNTISFVTSLSAALLLVSGIPLRNSLLLRFLSIIMCASLTFLAMTYLTGVLLVTPDPVFGAARETFKKFMRLWIGLLVLYSLFITIHFLVWLVKRCRELFRCLKNERNSSQSRN